MDLDAVDEALACGTRVGDFVIDHPLGAGPLGQVYGAVHHLIGKAAAVKVRSRGYSGDPQVVARFMSEARAVNAIAHRNIVDIFDFGVAKLVDAPNWSEHQTQTRAAIGTPADMSPERCLGQPVDHRTDVYALDVLFFQLLTGQLPFRAESAVKLSMKHVSEAPPAPSSLRPGIPPEVDRVLDALPSKPRAARPPTAERPPPGRGCSRFHPTTAPKSTPPEARRSLPPLRRSL